MVDITRQLTEIKALVDQGEYFTMNRARQYGKTTTLRALADLLRREYVVISLDFQMFSHANFEKEQLFVSAFSEEVLDNGSDIPEEIQKKLMMFAEEHESNGTLLSLFKILSKWCGLSEKPIVLIIDEVDSATNNQVFLDFLAQLRGYYINRDRKPAFQSVILAGVYDVRNIQRKIRTSDEHKVNSPWNIAADFNVEMSFSVDGIAGMLKEYEADHHTGMNIGEIAQLIYEYTSGYPYLVSRICKLMDEKISANDDYADMSAVWKKEGVLEAVKILLSEKNTLFESLIGKLQDYPELKKILYSVLFGGEKIVYNPDDEAIDIATMFGFIKNQDGNVTITNRIFETRLYNYFLITDNFSDRESEIYKRASENKNQFIDNGHLNMRLLLERFVVCFNDIYGSKMQEFDEEEGRRRFLMFIRPVINGTGNYYIEAETRNSRRMDLIIDYLGEQFVIELKIWRGNAYHERGETQLADYLEYFHLKKGYMLSYNFNQKKKSGVREIQIDDKLLIEAVV
jgi:hypothetical protein